MNAITQINPKVYAYSFRFATHVDRKPEFVSPVARTVPDREATDSYHENASIPPRRKLQIPK